MLPIEKNNIRNFKIPVLLVIATVLLFFVANRMRLVEILSTDLYTAKMGIVVLSMSKAPIISNEYISPHTQSLSLTAVVMDWKDAPYTVYAYIPGQKKVMMQKNSDNIYEADTPLDMLAGNQQFDITYKAFKNFSLTESVVHVSIVQTSSSIQAFTNKQNSTKFSAINFYVMPEMQINKVILALKKTAPEQATALEPIAQEPQAMWIDSDTPISQIETIVKNSSAMQAVPIFTIYDASRVSCNEFIANRSIDEEDYLNWIRSFRNAIGSSTVIVIMEPDALAKSDCFYNSPASSNLVANAIDILKFQTKISVYIDAGNSHWINASDMAAHLKNAGIEKADGFSLNVSNFMSTGESISYGMALSNQLSGKHFVIDTGRNGNGPTSDFQWCNPPGRALGENPTTKTNNEIVDAYLWIKPPGESDGTCNGGPAEGVFWTQYALGLIKNKS